MSRTDQGVSKTRYATIPRTLIFLFRDQSILLLKGSSSKKIWANRYNGIGGHIERGEDILNAGRRELLEETGIKNIELYLCGIIMIDTGEDRGITLYVLKGACNEKEPIASDEGLPEWIPINQLTDYPLVEDLPLLIPRILSMNKNEPPFYASYHYDEKDDLVINFAE